MKRFSHLLVLVAILVAASPLSLRAAEDIQLSSPLTTLVRTAAKPDAKATAIHASVVIPKGAPADLGVGAFVADDDGTWWQVLHPERLTPGMHELAFDLRLATTRGESHRGRWSPRQAELVHETGLFFWSEQVSRSIIRVEHLYLSVDTPTNFEPRYSFDQFDIDGVQFEDGIYQTKTSQRVTWRLRPHPFPVDVYDPHNFSITITLTSDQHQEQVSGFYRQAMDLIDVGSHEDARLAGADGFEVRWRPRYPGRYRVDLAVRWGSKNITCELPELLVGGETVDPYARIDKQDPRFFSTGDGDLVWPIGINARSVYDPRTAEYTGSRLTPNRGWHSYRDYIDRWAANGLTCAEIWMCSWGLALEWRDDWPGFHGIEAYSQANAERLDRVLDYAWERGIRINLVINNHGQASTKTDKEWHNNPWNRELIDAENIDTGPLKQALDWFQSKRAKQGQDRLRRYIVARWADHPAVLAWKLTSEMNLTDAGRAGTLGRKLLREWHQYSADQWHQIDPYGHPVTSHWSGNYRTPDRAIVALRELDFVSIDAYHGGRENGRGTLLAQLVWDGVHERRNGLGRFGKPLLITEYGGHWNAAPEPQLIAEHETGPWASFVSGYAGSPMLWWLEWVDQENRYGNFAALAKFIEGEDLRSKPGSTARAVELTTSGWKKPLWCRAWARPGRLMAYLMDEEWGFDGKQEPTIKGSLIMVGNDIRAGSVFYEWWDCNTGTILAEGEIQHKGGRLQLGAPPFQKHIALKLWR